MNIFFPCLLGLIGAFFYQKSTNTYKPCHVRNYLRSFIVLVLLQLLLWIVTGSAACVKCEKCQPMWIDQSDRMLEKYKWHFEKCEKLYKEIELIQEHHKYDFEDAFVSGACGGILATQIPEARAKAVAVALTVAADYFKENYYCHRALRRYAESYRYEVFQMEMYKDQLLENIMMCSHCEKQYTYENYDGLSYYKYLEYWKSWWDDRDAQLNFGPGCWHTYKNTYKFAGDE